MLRCFIRLNRGFIRLNRERDDPFPGLAVIRQLAIAGGAAGGCSLLVILERGPHSYLRGVEVGVETHRLRRELPNQSPSTAKHSWTKEIYNAFRHHAQIVGASRTGE